MSLKRVLEVVLGEVGVTEFPKDSNQVKYNTEYYGYEASGPHYPWCVTFLWWVFRHADEAMAFFNSGKTASCSALMTLYKAEGKWVTENYQPGDILLMNFSGGKLPEHCGLVVEVHPTYLITVEGNTTPGLEGSQDNGGSVAKKYRFSKNIVGACRPDYKEEETVPKTDYEDHWAKKDIEFMKLFELMNGYPDGSFKPDASITRAEVAAVIHRLYNLLKDGD